MEIDYKSLKLLADSLSNEFSFLRYEMSMRDLFKIKSILDKTMERIDGEDDINE